MIRVSVGIPTYNEQSNIKDLLVALLSQKQEGFELCEIIVLDDCSTDNTIVEAMSVSDQRIIVKKADMRGGKSPRFRDLCKMFNGDLLVQFDADVRLANDNILSALVLTQQKERADLVCANISALPPRTYIENLSYFGNQIWWGNVKDALGENAIVYRCQGRGRLFTRNFLSKFELPNTSGEDVFSFFYAVTNGYKVSFSKEALLYFRLPSTWQDYWRQSKRFIVGESILMKYFKKEVVDKYYRPTTRPVKLKALWKSILEYSPLVSIGHISTQAAAHYFATAGDAKFIWADVPSTKILK